MTETPRYSTIPVWNKSSEFKQGNICRGIVPYTDQKFVIGNYSDKGCHISDNQKAYIIEPDATENYDILNVDPSHIELSPVLPKPLEQITVGLFDQIACQATVDDQNYIGHSKPPQNTCNIAYTNTAGELVTKEVTTNIKYVKFKNPFNILNFDGCYQGTTEQLMFQGVMNADQCRTLAKDTNHKHFVMKNPSVDENNSVNSFCYLTNSVSSLKKVKDDACLSNVSNNHPVSMFSGQDTYELKVRKKPPEEVDEKEVSYAAVFLTAEVKPSVPMFDSNQVQNIEIAGASILTAMFVVFLVFVLMWSFFECTTIHPELSVCYRALICQISVQYRMLLIFLTLIGLSGTVLRIVINVMKKKTTHKTEEDKVIFDKKMESYSTLSHALSIPIYVMTAYFIYLLLKYKGNVSHPCILSLKTAPQILTSKTSEYED